MYEGFFANASTFFGAYLHQDFDIHADTVEGVARYFAVTTSHTEVRETLGELCVLAEMPGGDSEIAAMLQQFEIGVNLGYDSSESVAVRSLAREMAIAFAERLEREESSR